MHEMLKKQYIVEHSLKSFVLQTKDNTTIFQHEDISLYKITTYLILIEQTTF